MQSTYATSPDWVARLNELGRRGEPAFLLVDFEGERPRLWSEAAYLADEKIQFSFPVHSVAEAGKQYTYPGDLLCGTDFVEEAHYRRAFEIVQAGLQRGDSFLTNLTMPTRIELTATLEEVYRLSAAPYRICLRDEFVCFSPEIFVQITAEGYISSHPMKGTAEDTPAARQELLTSQKEIAEHATIVDLIRNDLSQVAKQVRVDDYRYLGRIETPRGALLQTSSKIGGWLPDNWAANLGTTIARLLPAGSVSGAPKPATTALIRAAEGRPRGYYCGIGVYFDGKSVDSCVLIRFIENHPTEGHLFWAGGGITARSNWQDEYAELCAKVRIPLRAEHFFLF